MGRVPSIEQATTDPEAFSGLPLSMNSEGFSHLPESVLSHLKHPDLVGGAKTVLYAPQDPVGGMAVPLKIQTVSTMCSRTLGPATVPSLSHALL